MASVPASELCFLSSLPQKRQRDKVRFLGCVTSYDTATGTLTLQHQYPSLTRVRALVNVDLVLERLTSEQMAVGAWVNVMGYVQGGGGAAAGTASVNVQALLLWSAGPLDLQDYEKRLDELLGIGRSGGAQTSALASAADDGRQ